MHISLSSPASMEVVILGRLLPHGGFWDRVASGPRCGFEAWRGGGCAGTRGGNDVASTAPTGGVAGFAFNAFADDVAVDVGVWVVSDVAGACGEEGSV